MKINRKRLELGPEFHALEELMEYTSRGSSPTIPKRRTTSMARPDGIRGYPMLSCYIDEAQDFQVATVSEEEARIMVELRERFKPFSIVRPYLASKLLPKWG